MTKVIKGEFEKLESLKISDVSLTCNTSPEIFNKEFNRMSRMDDDLLTYEVEIVEARGDDEVELNDKESSDFEVANFFRIETNVFDFKTHLCRAFKEFSYLLQIDPDVLTKDIEGFKTYEDDKDDWIYEWNKDVPWYEALKDGKLKEEALKKKAIMEGIIKDEDNKSSNEGPRSKEIDEVGEELII
ncbi:hypothetical protein Tco_1094846 [Tanacetum coccineum]|uniref:Uncharacterized protein n=1 Tax=Tanacetum coccineum TaxID=301880 RepID=A0ABQ5IGW4_9ASTR